MNSNKDRDVQHSLVEDLLTLRKVRDEAIEIGDVAALDRHLNTATCRLYRVQCLTYEKDFPRQEAFENVVASINNVNCRLVYYLRGTGGGVEFYIGVVRTRSNDSLNIGDYGNMLSRAFRGNFLGSQLKELKNEELQEVLAELHHPNLEYSTLLGVPTRNSQREDISFQGVERLVNIMTSGGRSLGQSFHLLVVWEPVVPGDVVKFENEAKTVYSLLSGEAKRNVQRGQQRSEQHGISVQNSESLGTNEGKSFTRSTTTGTSTSSSQSTTANSSQKSEGRSDTESGGSSKTTTRSEGHTDATTTSSSDSASWEEQNKFVQDVMDHIKEELQPRIRRGKAKGMYKTAVYVGAETPLNRALLENALISICQGDKPTLTPLYARPLPRNEATSALVASFSINNRMKTNASLLFLDSRPVMQNSTVSLATWLTASEISMLAALPQKEVPGMELREQVSFGLNIGKPATDDRLELGHMMQEGSHLEGLRVCLDRRELTKHAFIAGTTGSGKTTTCHKLLSSSASSRSPLPFLVVEPAKTEYRTLLQDPLFKNTVIFTVGNEAGVPFRFNPFEFLPEESLSGHVDLLKACFMASFDMEAAIPNLLEEGLYRVYEAYGWNFRDSSNRYLERREDAWNGSGCFFPTISSYIDVILELIEEKGFDERLRDEYKGSIRARLDSLRAGAKGLMLDTPLSVDFMELIDKQVILELEGVKSGEDKAFLMGLVLGRMIEALKIRHSKDPSLRHITLVEEAHRLLTRPMAGDSPNRRLGVETFTDLLAEVRKYGESLIIVDQIPSKLAPEVLKNTNTKIIHKLFARDDKDVVGDTMALSDKQKAYLSHLAPGEAIIFSQGWKKPVDVQVEQLSEITTEDADVPQETVMHVGWEYWLKRPHLFCAGLSGGSDALSRATLLGIVRRKEEFWDAVLKKGEDRDWRKPYLELKAILGDRVDGIILALFTAWEMRFLQHDTASRKSNLENMPRYVEEFTQASDDDWKYYAQQVREGCF